MVGERARTRVAVVGTGRAGVVAVAAVHARPDMELVGWLTTSRAKVGQDAGEFADVPAGTVALEDAEEFEAVIAAAEAEVVLYAGINDVEELIAWFGRAAEAGVDLVSVAGPAHPRAGVGDEAALSLGEHAARRGVRLLSTGVNPGLLLDTLPLVCASLSPTRDIRIRATRRSDIRWWGSSILGGYGIGQDPAGWETGEPYVSMRESVWIIIDALGLEVDEVTEEYHPLVASETRTSDGLTVAAGTIGGFEITCQATRGGVGVVVLSWVGAFGASEDWAAAGTPLHELAITGDIDVRCSLEGPFLGDSYPATVGRALNAIAPLRSLPAGLYRPDQVPLSVH